MFLGDTKKTKTHKVATAPVLFIREFAKASGGQIVKKSTGSSLFSDTILLFLMVWIIYSFIGKGSSSFSSQVVKRKSIFRPDPGYLFISIPTAKDKLITDQIIILIDVISPNSSNIEIYTATPPEQNVIFEGTTYKTDSIDIWNSYSDSKYSSGIQFDILFKEKSPDLSKAILKKLYSFYGENLKNNYFEIQFVSRNNKSLHKSSYQIAVSPEGVYDYDKKYYFYFINNFVSVANEYKIPPKRIAAVAQYFNETTAYAGTADYIKKMRSY